MLLRDLIREYTQSRTELPPAPPARPVPQTHVCPKCKMESGRTAVEQGAMICPACGAYFRMNARERITHTFDAGSFQELDADVTSVDFLSFPGYAEKLEKARKTTGENEAVLCGTAAIGGMFCATFVMDSSFIMASMGSAVGEKITRLFEFALAQRLPVIGFTASGGARMMTAAREALLPFGKEAPLLIAVTVLTSMEASDLQDLGITLSPADYAAKLAALTQRCGLDGVVCSAQEAVRFKQELGQAFKLVTPGIRPQGSEAGDQRRIMTPEQAQAAGVDYMVIGRPVTQSADPAATLRAINVSLSKEA